MACAWVEVAQSEWSGFWIGALSQGVFVPKPESKYALMWQLQGHREGASATAIYRNYWVHGDMEVTC